MSKRTWTPEQLKAAAASSKSIRQVMGKLGFSQEGGNYEQIRKYFKEFNINTDHFTGRLWNKGLTGGYKPRISLNKILLKNSSYQSFKLKKRLFNENLKPKICELCGWSKISADGRLPLELDHINGDKHDNRIENLRILCPNCHSLCPTHRGRNMKKCRDGGTGRRPTLKMS